MSDPIHRSDTALGSLPIPRLLFKLALPATVSMMINALYNLVDAIFVGQAAGPLAIAALAVAFPVQQIIVAIGQMFGQGAASIVSRALGARQADEAAFTAGSAMTISFLTIAALAALAGLNLDAVLRIFGADAAVVPYGHAYLKWILVGAPFVTVAMTGNNLLRAEGKMTVAMTTMMVGAVLNIILDPIFIFALGMGVEGAGLATAISQIAAFLTVMVYYSTGRSVLNIKPRHFRPRLDLVRSSTILGFPIFVRQGANSVIATLINNLLIIYGTAISVAVYGTVNRLLMFMFMPMFGMVQAFQPMVGYNYGARSFDRVRQTIRVTVLAICVYGAVATALLFAFPHVLFRLFTSDGGLIDQGVPALRLIVSMLPFIGIQIVGAGFFQSTGHARPALALGMLRQIILLIPLVLILPRFYGLVGIWIAFPIADLLSTIVTAIVLARTTQKLRDES